MNNETIGGVTHWANPDHSETITAELKAHNLSMGGAPAAAVARYTIALAPVIQSQGEQITAAEPQPCTSALMKIAADLANRKPLNQLYRICETQGRVSADSLHEHLDKAGDLLAGIALDIRHAITKAQPQADVQADHNRLVRELDVLLNGEAGAADQASLCDIVAQVRMARKKPGTGSLQLLALVPDQVVGRVHRAEDVPDQACVELNSCGRALPDHAPLYSRPADTLLRYVRAPSRKDPKYHEVWPEIEGGPVFDGETYCNDLFKALKHYNVIVAETMPENEVDE